MKKSVQCSTPGMSGCTGLYIHLYTLFKLTSNTIYQTTAETLLEKECDSVSYNLPATYSNGLSGIGTGIIWLLNNNFIDGDPDEILVEIDLIMQNISYSRSLTTPGLAEGVCGPAFYLYQRILQSQNQKNLNTLRSKAAIINYVDWLETFLIPDLNNEDLWDIYFLLVRLYKLDIYNYKIERLINLCLEISAKKEIIHPEDKYEYLGIPSLKILTPWI